MIRSFCHCIRGTFFLSCVCQRNIFVVTKLYYVFAPHPHVVTHCNALLCWLPFDLKQSTFKFFSWQWHPLTRNRCWFRWDRSLDSASPPRGKTCSCLESNRYPSSMFWCRKSFSPNISTVNFLSMTMGPPSLWPNALERERLVVETFPLYPRQFRFASHMTGADLTWDQPLTGSRFRFRWEVV